MAKHYTAVLEVTAVDNVEEARDRYNNVTTTAKRDVSEVGRVVVRAESLEMLVEKIKAHASLLAE
jgi:hypothetical protein